MIQETQGKSDEWYTPKYVFDALECEFDMDVASPADYSLVHTPANKFIWHDSLTQDWLGFVWMNPPFKKDKMQWIQKMISHGNGIALLPDRSSSSWWQFTAIQSDALLQIGKRIRFYLPDGSRGTNVSGVGTTLFAFGQQAVQALLNAQRNRLGLLFKHYE